MNFEEHNFMRIIMNGMIRCLRIFFNFYLKKKTSPEPPAAATWHFPWSPAPTLAIEGGVLLACSPRRWRILFPHEDQDSTLAIEGGVLLACSAYWS